jgi:uncharacterized protein YprB with RNaseH-like and TPR domain
MSDLDLFFEGYFEKKIPAENTPSAERKDIHEILAGSYVDPHQNVFVREWVQPSPLLPESSDELPLPLPDILWQWAGLEHLRAIPRSAILFVDTETSGLAGGTGTYPFLVGLGFFDRTDFVVRQYFLRDLSGEEAFLEQFEEFLAAYRVLVSFNGKSFDIPLLQTRLILQQRATSLAGFGQIDLLHLARRVWKGLFPSYALQSLESRLLGQPRDQSIDIPGWQIPAVYFEYLETRDARNLLPIFQHNLVDVVSMVKLLDLAARCVDYQRPEWLFLDGSISGIGRLYEDAGSIAMALPFYETAQRTARLDAAARAELARLYKKLGQWEQARALWLESAELGDLPALIELAKLAEHHDKDIPAALAWTCQALQWGQRDALSDMAILVELDRRRRRLEEKLQRRGK